MIRRHTRYGTAAALIVPALAAADEAAPAAASAEIATGLSNVGPAALLIAAAFLMVAALLFRGSASRITRWLGEYAGRRRIRRVLRRRGAEVLEDFILPGAYGGLTRVDFAVLTSGGILCINAKHYQGAIFGGEELPQWKNVDGVRQQKFLNPLIQNAGRTRALQQVVPGVPVANLVVFTGPVQVSTIKAKNVIHVGQLDSYIAKFVFGPSKVKDWDAVWLTVRSAALTDEGSRRDFQAQLSFS